MTRLISISISIIALLMIIGGVGEVSAQQAPQIAPGTAKSLVIDSSPSKSLLLFFAAVTEHDYAEARKFLPRDIVKLVEKNNPGGFNAFIDEVEKENAGNKLVVNSETIEGGKAVVETVTITIAGKKFNEKWVLRLEDELWKLDLFQPR